MKIVGFVMLSACTFAHALDFGAAVIGGNAAFEAMQRSEEIERQRQRHELEMERMRLQNEVQKRQIENARRDAIEKEKSQEQQQEEARTLVQLAIEQVPNLKSWQSNDPLRWNRAREIDAIMRQLPENANLPLVERFRRVARYVELEFQASKAP